MKLNKKGFTLIELLAVIVVLGIVMVIGVTTVLPLLNDTKEEAIKTEAKAAIDAASNAVTLISIDKYDGDKEDVTGGYCFTLENLRNAELLKKNDIGNYKGKVVATKDTTTGIYNYTITMTDGENYHVTGNASNVTAEDSTKIVKKDGNVDTSSTGYGC